MTDYNNGITTLKQDLIIELSNDTNYDGDIPYVFFSFFPTLRVLRVMHIECIIYLYECIIMILQIVTTIILLLCTSQAFTLG